MKNLLFALPVLLTLSFCSSKSVPNFDSPEVKAGQLLEQIQEGAPLQLEGKTVLGDLDFTKLKNPYLEGKGIYRHEVSSSLTFINCTFKGKLTAFSKSKDKVNMLDFLRNCSFISCTFEEAVDFSMSTIHGEAKFQNSVFKNSFSLTGTRFQRTANFNEVNFQGDFKAQDVQFIGVANFMDADWDQKATFQSAQFHQKAQFSVARFFGYVEFNSVWAQKDFLFSYAQFHDRAYFNNARFDDRVDFFNSEFKKDAAMKNSRYYAKVMLKDVFIKSSFSLEGCYFTEKPAGWESLQQQNINLANVSFCHKQ